MQFDALKERGREGQEKRADREAQNTSHDAIKDQCETLEKQLSDDATRQYQFQIPLGCVTIDLRWIPRYASRLSDHTLQGPAHGHARQHTHLNEALHLVSPTPLVSFAPITSMFGLIRGNTRIVGPDTLKQALARAGRSHKNICVLAGHIDHHLLALVSDISKNIG